jgi:bifunctional non-homologous end joining protein LigD
MAQRRETLEAGGHQVVITNPGKVFFPATGHTKLDLARYYLSVAGGALRGVAGRPMVLKRFVNGADGEAFFQKRAPRQRPDWVDTVVLSFPSGRTAEEVVPHGPADLAWVVNLGCIDLNPHPVRAADLDHPDELRVDLDPVPGVEWPQIRQVALVARDVMADFGLAGWPKTSGSRGFHIYARIAPRWTFTEVRRAAVALAREIERRVPELATARWWKEERHGVFVDYNQNAKDRTVASAYSVRPTRDARVSTPLTWEEVPGCQPEAFTISTVPARFAALGDPWEQMDEAAGSLEPLLALAAEHEAAGLPDAPWPPHYAKQAGEPPRVQPSRARGTGRSPARPGDGSGARGPGAGSGRPGRRRLTMPLIEVARAATQAEAMAGLDRWKARHPSVCPYLEPADVLVDSMRGRSSTWTRIRLNLRHVPEAERPPQEELEVDYDPWAGSRPGGPARRLASGRGSRPGAGRERPFRSRERPPSAPGTGFPVAWTGVARSQETDPKETTLRFAIKTRPEHTTWAQIRDLWLAADEVSLFESAWNWDHFYPLSGDHTGPNLEGWTMLAALAEATRRIRIGCQVTGMVYRHPAVLANMAATVDIISGGRLELGLGAGWNTEECDAYGIDLPPLRERFDRFDEGVAAIVALLSQETTTLHGRYVRLTGARCEPKPVQRPHPPVTIGGRGRTRTLRTAARWAQQWNAITESPQEWASLRETLAGHCATLGRDLAEITCSANIRVDGTGDVKRAAEVAAAYAAAGADLVIMNLPLAADPAILEPLADALAALP